MATQKITPNNLPEKVLWYSLVLTYPIWLIGATYIVAPVMAWLLLIYLFVNRHQYFKQSINPFILFWTIAILIMLFGLIMGHLLYQLPWLLLIKSSIGWAKGWALIALFMLLAIMPIRAELIYRACCIIAKQTVWLLPLFIMAWLLKLPSPLYTSPLSIFSGAGPEFFTITLYEIDPGSGLPRWRFFAPWAPAAGMMGNLFYICALQEKDTGYKTWGIIGSLCLILMSQSRLALACFLVLSIYFIFVKQLKNPWLYFLGAPLVMLASFFSTNIVAIIDELTRRFTAYRAASSRVRSTLADIAIQRWLNEAPIWGHGVVERGTHLVEYMLIGTHHTWYGLLFIKGIIGLIAFALPLSISFIYFILNFTVTSLAQTAVAMLILLSTYSFGENLEILIYLFWPSMLIVGLAHKEVAQNNALQNAETV